MAPVLDPPVGLCMSPYKSPKGPTLSSWRALEMYSCGGVLGVKGLSQEVKYLARTNLVSVSDPCGQCHIDPRSCSTATIDYYSHCASSHHFYFNIYRFISLVLLIVFFSFLVSFCLLKCTLFF